MFYDTSVLFSSCDLYKVVEIVSTFLYELKSIQVGDIHIH